MVFEGAADHAIHGEILERRFFGRRVVRLWTDDGSPVDDGGRRDRPRAAAAVHQARRSRRRSRSVSDRVRAARADRSPRRRPACISRRRWSRRCGARGVEIAEITLHVGYGTFQPVRVDRVEDHRLEPRALRDRRTQPRRRSSARARDGRRIIAVGTTTTRTLEAVARGARRRDRRRARRDRSLHLSGLRVPRRRRPADQLPPAAVVAADARRRRSPAASAC